MIATPLPGTELHSICVGEGYIEGDLTPEQLANCTEASGEPLIATDDFSRDDVRAIAEDYEKQLRKERVRFHLTHPFSSARKIGKRVVALVSAPGSS